MHRFYRVSYKLLVLGALFLGLVAAFPVSAQTTVTPAPGPGYTFCVGGSYATIGTIQITENVVNSYPVTGGLTRFRLRLPAGFSFNSAIIPTITAPGPDDFNPDPAFVGYFNGNTEIEISYQVTTITRNDVISIANLQVHATAVGSGNIIRVASAGPEANQPGNNVGNNVSHGTLTSANFSVSLSSSDANNQVCVGELVTFTAASTITSSSKTYQFFKNGVSVQGPGTFAQYTSALNDNDEITVTATYTSNGCTSIISPGSGITTDVLPLPIVDAPAGPYTICGNGFADLTGTTFSNSTGIAWASSGDGSFQPNALTVNAKYYPGPNDIINGSAVLTITTTGSICTAATDNVTVNVNPLPTPVISGLNAVCGNQVGVVYSSPNVVGHTYVWAITGGTITAGSGTNSITVTWGAAGAGTLQLTQTITSSLCAVTTSLYNVTKNANPTPVISGPATVCASHAGDVYNTTSVGGHSYSWTVSGGTITAGAGTNSITVTWGSGATGTVQLTETITATGCATATANYNVAINALPTPVISGLNAVCENQVGVVYSSPNVVGHTYVWAITGGTITAGSGTNSITVTWGAAGAGTLQLTQTITSSLCAVTTSLYNVTKNANPTPVISGPATVCASHAGDVYNTTSVGGHSYSWTVSGGTITAGAGTNSITVTWGSGATGTVQLTETITATGCATATANYNVAINALPTPVISGLNAVCENQVGVVYSSPNVVGHTYVWAITGGTITAGSGTNSITVTWGAAGAGTLQLTETITSSLCAVTTSLYNVIKNANPTPVISGPATVCASHAGDVYTTANVGGHSYSWTVSGGTITAGAGTNSITVTWGSGATGTVQLTETITATGCATATANYPVAINALPTPVISGLNAVCENQVAVVYSSPNVVGHTYSWSITGGSITAGAGTNSITVTWGAAGAGTLQLTETITSSLCAVTTSLYNVIKNANPTPVISGPATVCASHAGDVYTTANVGGHSYSWTVSGGTITAGAGSNSITVTWGSGATGTVQLTETITATGCATATANYPVAINALPTPVISGLNAVCENQVAVLYSSPNVVGHTYSWSITGGSITAGAGTNSITVTWGAAGAGTLQLTETITSSLCAVTTSLYNVIKNANPTPVISGPATVCASHAGDVYSTTNVGGHSYSWTVSGGTITAGAGSNSITVTWGSGATGTVQLTETITATGCATATANYPVAINALPTPVISGLNAVCENQVAVVYSSPNVVGHTYSWSITGGSITAGAGTNSITVTWGAAGAGTLQLTETITSSLCAVTTSLYNVTKNANPTPVISGPATVCASHAGDVYTTANVGGHSYSWTVSGGTITAGAGSNSITVTWGSGATGTVQLTETITATGCATATANYPVAINALPTPVISGLNAVCENQVAVLYSSPNVVGHTYSWSITGGSITAGAGTNSITVTWGAAGAGTLQLTETITSSLCAVTTSLYNVTKNANPTPVISGPATVCASHAGDVYTTANVGGHSYSWTVSGGTITAGAGSNSITVTWGSGATGTVQLTETITATGCATATANYPVAINALPTPVISGLNAVCANQVAVLYSSPNVVGHTYSWSITGGSITAGAGTNSITVTWGAAGAGTLQLTETITSSLCAVTTSLYNVTKNANPTPVISGPATVCASHAGDVYTTANVGGHSYSWTVSGGTITAGAGSNSITVTWGSGATGTVQLTETITATGCATATANYPVAINALPTPVISGLNAVCENQVAVLYSSPNVVGHTYSWSITGGSITAGAGTNSITVTWGAAGAGTLQLTETITSSLCAVTTSLYNVTKNANPTPVISGPATVCASHAGDVYTTANVGGHSYSWTVSGGTITAGAGSNSITVTWGSGATGTVQLTETITATGCATATANYPVAINALPTPVISGLNAVCANQVAVLYSSPNVVGHTYSWSITGGSITAGAGTNSITVTWGAAGAGTLQLTETITSSLCAVTTSLYNVTKNANPTPVISGPATVCASHAGDVYTTTNVGGHSYSWTVSGGTITAGAGSNSITVTWGSGATGTVQLTETITATGCATATANYPVAINALPTPVISGLNAVCENQVAVLYSSPNVVGHTYSWSITGGSITAGAGTNSITVTWGAAGAGTLQLTETITSSLCAVTTSLYNVTKNANPTPVISGPATVCASHAGDVYTTANVGGHSYSWTVSGGTITAGAGSNSITVTWGSGATGTVQLTETITATGCATATANYPVAINALPTPVISGLNAVCENQVAVLYSSPNVVGHTYSWSITGGSITAGAGTNSITVTWGAAGAGTLQLTETITSSLCAVTTSLYNVTKNANPTPVISGPATVCASHAGDVYTTANVGGHSYSWTVSGGTITAGAGSNSITVTWGSGATGTVQLTETITATGCATATANYPVAINALPTPVISGLNAVCENQVAVLYSSPNVVGHTYSWSITGGSITAGAGTNSITVTWGAAGAGTLQLTETITSSLCAVTTSLYNVTKNANPTPVISGPATVCASHAGDVYTTANVGGHSYSWTVSGGTITAGAGSNSITVTWGSGATGTVQLTETITATGCAITATNYNVTINPNPVVALISNQIACNATTVPAINLSASTGGGETFTWTGGASVGMPNGSDNTAPFAISSFTGVNTGTSPVTVPISVSASKNGCSGPVQNFNVTINPSPTMSITNPINSICSNTPVGITLGSTTSGAIIRLASVNYNGVTGTIATPQYYVPGSTITESLINPTNSPIIVTYNFDVSANGCTTAGPFTTTVEVKPSPIFSINNLTPQVCEGSATDITLNTPTLNGKVRLDAVNYNGATGTLAVGTLFNDGQKITEVLVNPTNSPIIVTYTFSVSATSCSNPVQQQTTVSITRKPTVFAGADTTVCQLLLMPLKGKIGTSAVNGLWSIVSGLGDLSASNLSGTTVRANYALDTLDVGNTIILRLTTNDPDGPGPCAAEFDDINIKINRAADITAGIDLAQCRDQASIALQGGITYAPNGVSWNGGAGSFGTITSPTSTYSFNSSSEIGTNVLLTLTANDPDGTGLTGPCGSVTDQMILRINQLPTVNFSGLPGTIAENATTSPTLTGNQSGGIFTILPATSSIGSTTHTPVDIAEFDPSAVELGLNYVTYTFTDANGCTDSQKQQVLVNPVTEVDFTLQYWDGTSGTFVPPNGTGGYNFCSNVGTIRIVGDPVAGSGGDPTDFEAIGADSVILKAKISHVGEEYFIDTNGLAPGDYTLRYTYTNADNVTSSFSRAIRVFSSPVAAIDNLLNNCINDGIAFKDASYVAQVPFPASITGWAWDFGDGATSTAPNPPLHMYELSGVYDVQLIVTTNQLCSNSTSLSIRVGDVPLVDFKWSAICTNDRTKFEDKTDPGSISTIVAYSWDFGEFGIITGAPTDSIPLGTHGGTTSGTYQNPEHNYGGAGVKNVVLTVETNDGCNNSKPKTISILASGPTVTPDALNPYSNAFEAADQEWIPEAFEIAPDDFSKMSWQFGVPTGAVINASPTNGTTSAWWTGANVNSYFPSEQSAVNGPCFDLQSLSRPMITLDYWSDAEQNLDGATLQFSTDGGLNWYLVGPEPNNPNEGIEWYKGQTVQSTPGGQPFGWTGKLTGWKTGRFNLDMIPKDERDQVRLRIAFSSNSTNDPNKTFDGFAFDNVFIGERKRNVMVEYFTNAGLFASTNTYFDDLYADQFVGDLPKDSSDFFKLQYHIANPSEDPINQDNPVDPGVRSLFYGISKPPTGIMDGILGNYYGTTFNGNHLLITEEELERRSLEDPLFDIKIDTLTATSTSIKFHIEFTYKHPTLAFSSPVSVHAVLVEDNVPLVGSPDQRNIVRKFLLGTEGVTLDQPWTFDQVESIDRDIQIEAPIGTDNTDLYLVAFIQDKRIDSKVIHQALKIKLNKKSQATITGIEDDPILAQVKDIAIYPNPATRYINFATEATLTRDYQYTIVDQRGITVLSGNLNRDLTIPQQVELSNIADGVYIVMIHQGNRRLLQRKLAVLKR